MRAPVEDDAGLIGLDEGVERLFDDGLRHLLAVDERLVRPRLLRPRRRRLRAAAAARKPLRGGLLPRQSDPNADRNRATGSAAPMIAVSAARRVSSATKE